MANARRIAFNFFSRTLKTVGLITFVLAFNSAASAQGSQTKSPPTEAELEEMIMRTPAAGMFVAMQSYFPEDAELFIKEMQRITSSEEITAKAAGLQMVSVGAHIRRKHANKLLTAPDGALISVLMSQVQIYRLLEDTPLLCNRAATYGAGALINEVKDPVFQTAVQDAASVLFRAMYEGEKFPTKRLEVQDADWVNLVEYYFELGGTEQKLDLVSEIDITNPLFCDAMIEFLDATATAEFKGADRIRAYFALSIMEG